MFVFWLALLGLVLGLVANGSKWGFTTPVGPLPGWLANIVLTVVLTVVLGLVLGALNFAAFGAWLVAGLLTLLLAFVASKTVLRHPRAAA